MLRFFRAIEFDPGRNVKISIDRVRGIADLDGARIWDGKRHSKLRSILPATGVYAKQSFMIVPRTGFDMVCLRDSKDAHLSYDPGLSRVEDVHFEHGECVAQECLSIPLSPE